MFSGVSKMLFQPVAWALALTRVRNTFNWSGWQLNCVADDSIPRINKVETRRQRRDRENTDDDERKPRFRKKFEVQQKDSAKRDLDLQWKLMFVDLHISDRIIQRMTQIKMEES